MHSARRQAKITREFNLANCKWLPISIELSLTVANFGVEVSLADVLVITSKVKKFIKAKDGCNTSAETIDMLSKAVERLCQKGVDSAKADGRKTVMARDIVIDHV